MNIYRTGQVVFGILLVVSILLLVIWGFWVFYLNRDAGDVALPEEEMIVDVEAIATTVAETSTVAAVETESAEPSETPLPATYTPTATSIAIDEETVATRPDTGGGGGNLIYHTVEAGDTLFSLSKRYGLTVDDILRANGRYNDSIYAGELLLIPYYPPSTSNLMTPTATSIPEEVSYLSTQVHESSIENEQLRSEIASLEQHQVSLIEENRELAINISNLATIATAEAMAREINAQSQANNPENEETQNNPFNQENIIVMMPVVVSLVGLLSSTILNWREELRKDRLVNSELEQEKFKLSNELLKIEAEQKRLELEIAKGNLNSAPE